MENGEWTLGTSQLSGKIALSLVILSTTSLVPSCNFFGQSALTSIAVTPATPSIAVGATQQMVATVTYSDGSTKNISSSAIWTSSDANTATLSSTRVVTEVAAGMTSVTAASGIISGATIVSVTYANLKSIEVTPYEPPRSPRAKRSNLRPRRPWMTAVPWSSPTQLPGRPQM
jgi:hypothetical protein